MNINKDLLTTIAIGIVIGGLILGVLGYSLFQIHQSLQKQIEVERQRVNVINQFLNQAIQAQQPQK